MSRTVPRGLRDRHATAVGERMEGPLSTTAAEGARGSRFASAESVVDSCASPPARHIKPAPGYRKACDYWVAQVAVDE